MRIMIKKRRQKKSKVEIPEHKFDLLECHFMPDLWKVLVTCILLNRTTRRQVERIIYGFFKDNPNAEMLIANKELIPFRLYSLGMATRRTETLVQFSKDYLEYEKGKKTIPELYGIGQYARDCWKLLFLDDFECKPTDKALLNYIKYYDEDFKICPICAMKNLVTLLDDGKCPRCLWHDGFKKWRKGYIHGSKLGEENEY